MKGYDYAYGKYKPRIELDEVESEYARCTCLDRARIALERSGQHTCAWMMKNLQDRFDELAEEYEMDSADPLGMLRNLL